MSVLERLTEGIVNRDLEKEGSALLNKWSRTGLLEGIDNERAQSNMARLLENQAKELLREASTMAGSDVEGFAAVAFPIVRRVFGGLIANDLVSVQPMSLPSGLIFFLDFTFNSSRLGAEANESLYGGGVVAGQLTGGVSLSGDSAEDSFYALNNGYASPTGSSAAIFVTTLASGTFGGNNPLPGTEFSSDGTINQAKFDKLCRFDPDLTSGTTKVWIGVIGSASTSLSQFNLDNLISITNDSGAGETSTLITSGSQVRRLTSWSGSNGGLYQDGDTQADALIFFTSDTLATVTLDDNGGKELSFTWVQTDKFETGLGVPGSVRGNTTWGLENNTLIPEIDIKVDSVAVTAVTKKLKAKWTPELGQDLNAYHNIDAEVELTGILSEQIALEIDREIMEDLVKGATAGTYYWARSPGLFVDRKTGLEVGASSAAPDFTGTVSQWYETLIETINDVSAQIHRKTLRGAANFVVVSPEVANILEFTAGFRASVTADDDRGTIGAVKVGSLTRKFDVYVDPYFPRNLVLVGRKGSGFLESGYVYAPYVPLQVTPTIFGTEDFVPRKGVMTRYAKKMVRADMYGLVIVRGLLGESGATS